VTCGLRHSVDAEARDSRQSPWHAPIIPASASTR